MGESANIPKTWALMTTPTAASPWPCWVMCSGVIVMTRTITTWPAMSATIATGTCGRRMSQPRDVAPVSSCPSDVSDRSARS